MAVPFGNIVYVPGAAQSAPPTKAEQWVFQKAILLAEFNYETKRIVWDAFIYGMFTTMMMTLFIGIPAALLGERLTHWYYWVMLFAPYPLSAFVGFMLKRKLSKWANKFLGGE